MISLQRIIFGVVWLVAIFLIGSLGYVFLEGWSFFEGLYMTVITLTTVGYGEIRPLSQTGRTFTILLIFLGVGFMLYMISALAQVVVEGQIRDIFGRRRLEREIRNIQDHYIICGFGRIGEVISRELSHNHIPIVVVDYRPQHSALEKSGYLHVIGNATQEEVLLAAGIERARGLISVVASMSTTSTSSSRPGV